LVTNAILHMKLCNRRRNIPRWLYDLFSTRPPPSRLLIYLTPPFPSILEDSNSPFGHY
jgi:hypothetical protein